MRFTAATEHPFRQSCVSNGGDRHGKFSGGFINNLRHIYILPQYEMDKTTMHDLKLA